MKSLVGLVAIVSLSGCASSTYFAQHSSNPHEATVYVIREHAEPLAWSMNILVDNKKAASLANHSFVKFSVPAGEHRFGFDWPILAASPSVRPNIGFKGGETRYFVVSGLSRVTGVYLFVILTTQSTRVVEVARQDGEKLIHQLKK
jgi:hypothetical protein